MKRNTLYLMAILLMGSAAMAWGAQVDAPDPPDAGAAPAISPLGVREDHVRRLVQRMEDKFVKLSKALEATEPEHAQKIIETLKAGKRELLEQRMAKVTELLNAGQLEQARAEQRKLIQDVDKLIDLLISTRDQRQREIDQLEQFHKQIEQLIAAQKQLRKQTDISQHRDKAIRKLDEQIAALRELIAAQKQLKDQTDQARSQGAPAVMELADKQDELRRQTDALGKQINKGPAGSPQTPKASGESATPGKSGESGKSGSSMAQASKHQQQAEQRLGAGQGVSAEKQQRKALEEMNKQLKKLQAQRDHITRLPKDAMNKLSDPQNKLADKTGDLNQQMQDAPGSSTPSSSADGSQQSGQSTPGQPQVQQAQQQMRQASGQMQKQQGDNAKQYQTQAIKALEQAQKQLEERLRQLRQETQEQVLAALEARFREMLSRQKPVTKSTADLEVSRQSRAEVHDGEDPHPLTRPEKFQSAQLASEENVLVEMAAKAKDIIGEDGTTVVLPQIVGQLHQDLRTTAKFLSSEQTGPYTQALQREIEMTLKELIDALQKAQEQPQQQPSQQGPPQDQQQQQQPLVPASAELKLLRAAQLRVNRRTKLFDTSRSDVRRLPPLLVEEVRRLSKRQEDVRQMTERLAEKQ